MKTQVGLTKDGIEGFVRVFIPYSHIHPARHHTINHYSHSMYQNNRYLNLKNLFLILFIFLICFGILSCDGRLRLKGFAYNNSPINGVVSDSLFAGSEKGIPVNDAKIMIYNFLDTDLSIENLKPTVILSTDSAGYFEWNTVIPPIREFSGALVTQKDGYRNDTLYFKYKSSIKPYKFIINLKKY